MEAQTPHVSDALLPPAVWRSAFCGILRFVTPGTWPCAASVGPSSRPRMP